METIKLKPCPYVRNPDPQGHKMTIQREQLQDFLEFAAAEYGFRAVCTCSHRGPLAGTEVAAAYLHNNGLP